MKPEKTLKTEPGLSSLQRPRYSPGLLLEDEDLTAGVDYTQNMMRLMMRHLFGCGVVCGLGVEAKLTCNGSKLEITVGSGLALDGGGNPIHLPNPHSLVFSAPDCLPMPERVWVAVCYRTKDCRPRDAGCAEGSERQFATRIRDGYEIRVYSEPPECACGCYEPPPKPKGREDVCREEATAKPSEVSARIHERDLEQISVSPECQCFVRHYEGLCDDDCCCARCTCVLLAKIPTAVQKSAGEMKKTTKPGRKAGPEALVEKPPVTGTDVQLEPDEKVRRRIRPLLTGYVPCWTQLTKATMDDHGQSAGQKGG